MLGNGKNHAFTVAEKKGKAAYSHQHYPASKTTCSFLKIDV
jgi:hypothetical protein